MRRPWSPLPTSCASSPTTAFRRAMRLPPFETASMTPTRSSGCVLIEVRKTFLTPFDRGAITSLIGAMDDAIDEMLAAARAIDLYELHELRPEMKEIVSVICEAASVTADAVPLLRERQRKRKQASRSDRSARQPGRQGGRIHALGLRNAFQNARYRSIAIRRRAGGVQEPRTRHGCIRGRGQRDRRHRHRPCINLVPNARTGTSAASWADHCRAGIRLPQRACTTRRTRSRPSWQRGAEPRGGGGLRCLLQFRRLFPRAAVARGSTRSPTRSARASSTRT